MILRGIYCRAKPWEHDFLCVEAVPAWPKLNANFQIGFCAHAVEKLFRVPKRPLVGYLDRQFVLVEAGIREDVPVWLYGEQATVDVMVRQPDPELAGSIGRAFFAVDGYRDGKLRVAVEAAGQVIAAALKDVEPDYVDDMGFSRYLARVHMAEIQLVLCGHGELTQCQFLTCQRNNTHPHPVCPWCGAVRFGNIGCPICNLFDRWVEQNGDRILRFKRERDDGNKPS